MSGARFQITRPDGRSNAQVLVDLVKDASPGQVFRYDDLADVLDEGTTRVFDARAVGAVVRQALPRLLKELQRALHNVRLVGYRVALARDHSMLAVTRESKANRQMRVAVNLLRRVRWDEMTENERIAHQGHLMITESVVANQQALNKRQQAIEAAIAKLSSQVAEMTKSDTA